MTLTQDTYMSARFPLILPGALLAAAILACGDDNSGPDPVVYEIAASLINTEPLPDGSTRRTYSVTVSQGNLKIAGAWMLFEASVGDVNPQTDRTDLSGNGRVEWTLDSDDIQGVSSATLSGCAQDLAPPDCTTAVLTTLTF